MKTVDAAVPGGIEWIARSHREMVRNCAIRLLREVAMGNWLRLYKDYQRLPGVEPIVVADKVDWTRLIGFYVWLLGSQAAWVEDNLLNVLPDSGEWQILSLRGGAE